jgi:hypothetical protein
MPTGQHLKLTISTLFKSRDGILAGFPASFQEFQYLLQLLSNTNKDRLENYLDAGNSIIKGLPLEISIDNFLHKHYENKYIVAAGKLAITFAILGFEHASKLFPKRDIFDMSKIHDTWYIPFYQKITEGCKINDLPERLKDFTFIIFNYDRCFERFFTNALMDNYGIEYSTALEIVKGMNIIHPYGMVGNGKFGEIVISRELIDISNNIKLYTEGIQSHSIFRDLFSNSKDSYKVIFLGFAYHKQNMDILFQRPFENQSIKYFYGTGLGISNKDIDYIQSYYTSHLGRSIHFEIVDNNCKEFFNEFQYRITFME